MKIVPLIYFQKRKIYAEKDGEVLSLKELLTYVDKDADVYVFDKDGVEGDKPNLCTYPKLSEHFKIWVDAGPRVLGDIVDEVMAGATNITVRTHLWPKADLVAIQEMTENDIYVHADLKNHNAQDVGVPFFEAFAGLIVFNAKDQIEMDFRAKEILRRFRTKNSFYAYESDPKHVPYWEKLGVKGLLVEINKIREFEKHGL